MEKINHVKIKYFPQRTKSTGCDICWQCFFIGIFFLLNFMLFYFSFIENWNCQYWIWFQYFFFRKTFFILVYLSRGEIKGSITLFWYWKEFFLMGIFKFWYIDALPRNPKNLFLIKLEVICIIFQLWISKRIPFAIMNDVTKF